MKGLTTLKYSLVLLLVAYFRASLKLGPLKI